MKNEILIGLGGLVLSVLTYFAGVIRTKKQFAKDDRGNRIDRVVEHYVRLSQAHQNNGLHGLIQAGIGNLKSDKEIRETCTRIIKHGEHSPCAALKSDYDRINLYLFFQELSKKDRHFFGSGNLNQLIQDVLNKGN